MRVRYVFVKNETNRGKKGAEIGSFLVSCEKRDSPLLSVHLILAHIGIQLLTVLLLLGLDVVEHFSVRGV